MLSNIWIHLLLCWWVQFVLYNRLISNTFWNFTWWCFIIILTIYLRWALRLLLFWSFVIFRTFFELFQLAQLLCPQIDNMLYLLIIFNFLVHHNFWTLITIHTQMQILIINIVKFKSFEICKWVRVFLTKDHILFKLAHEFHIIERMNLEFSKFIIKASLTNFYWLSDIWLHWELFLWASTIFESCFHIMIFIFFH